MKRVIIESPFAGPDAETVARNVRYARAMCRYALLQGCAPYASHLLYTQPGILDDEVPSERALGIEAGLCVGDVFDESWIGTDLGTSTGMRYGIARAEEKGRVVKFVELGPDWEEKWLGPDWEEKWLGPTKNRTF